jgi:hypothetical protein
MGLQGFSNNSSGGMSPGDPLYSKSYNNLASSADKAQFGPSAGAIFNSTNGGMAMYIESSRNDEGDPNLEQFQITVEGYPVGTDTTSFSIIRVVKGEVVWIPVLPQDNLPVPNPVPTDKCVTQTTIENWYALPTFPVIDDENSTYIGDGGIRVPNISGIDVGIFVFKSTMLPIDHDPIIIAVPNTGYELTCPVTFPGTPPFPLAVWQAIKVGSAKYEVPEGSEEDTPPQWIVTQNFIGSMVFPGGGGGGEANTPFLPPQLPSVAFQKARPAPFECRIDVDSSGDMLLKIGNGTISYTQSNMPWIQIGAYSEKFQYQYTKVQVVPTGWRKEASNGSDGWMELGGGYKISGEGQWYLCASYWDVWTGPSLSLPTPLQGRKPFLSLIDAYGSNVGKLFRQTGAGLYTQTMNVQKMTGYDSESTEEFADWMHCHSTWFNPMKYGYDIKMIARIESRPAPSANAQVSVSQLSSDSRNMIQNIYFPALPKDGFVVFTLDGIPSNPFYPSPWAGYNNAINLFNALQAIPALQGNISVTKTSEQNFYVTFINELEATDIPILAANNSGLESWPYEYIIDQYHTGSLTLDTEPKFNGTQIMNKEGVTSDDDPYTIQSNASPAFNKVVNREDMLACDNLEGDNNFTGMFPVVDGQVPNSWTFRNFSQEFYFKAGGCQDESECAPFKVKRNGVVGDDVVYEICTGTVNNIIPQNISDTFILVNGDSVWLRCDVNSSDNEYPYQIVVESGTTMPSDTDDFGYVKVATLVGGEIQQFITGSLWSDRIKLGTQTATYYYARI